MANPEDLIIRYNGFENTFEYPNRLDAKIDFGEENMDNILLVLSIYNIEELVKATNDVNYTLYKNFISKNPEATFGELFIALNSRGIPIEELIRKDFIKDYDSHYAFYKNLDLLDDLEDDRPIEAVTVKLSKKAFQDEARN